MSPSLPTTITIIPARYPASQTTPPAHHIGNPPTSFKNPWPSYASSPLISSFKKRWTLEKNYVAVPSDRAGLVKVRKPDFGADSNGLKATWIGHASFLVETPRTEGAERGMRVLIDPIWSDRAGPYGVVGPVRFTPPPCTIDELPEVDAVCFSHDHYDHLDLPTLKSLYAKQNGDLRFFCPLRIKSVLLGFGIGIRADQIHEMDWWDTVRLERDGVFGVDLVCAPGQHRSGRTPWGFDSTLWSSWIIKEPGDHGKRLYFAGDTGYCHVTADDQFSHHDAPHPPCPAFAEIGELYGPFDLALLPIGCFKPRSILSGQHSSPEDSLSIHKDIKSKKSIGMHYGVFRGQFSAAFEPVTEPTERWRKGAEAEGFKWGEEVGLCDVGETVTVE